MERRTVARALRAIRRRKGWSQRRLGARLGISKSELSRWETGALDACSVAEVETWATALGAHVTLELRFNGERPLADARHARIQTWFVELLRSAGWTVDVEASFNVYGDRGRIDVLGYAPAVRAVLVVEIKTRIDDAQDLLGRLDVKKRVAREIAIERGWEVREIVPAIVVAEGTTVRRHIAAHEALFASFPLRGRSAMTWLKRPKPPMPTGILMLLKAGATSR